MLSQYIMAMCTVLGNPINAKPMFFSGFFEYLTFFITPQASHAIATHVVESILPHKAGQYGARALYL